MSIICCMKAFIIIICLFGLVQSACDNTICDCQNSTCNYCLVSDFYYNSTAVNCKLCPPQCKTCNSKQQCLTCRDMFYLSGTSCLQCQKYCKTCASSSNCTQCLNGYILINSVCQQCQVANVDTCSSLMTVNTCLSGYWKNGDSCSPCRQFCLLCTSSNNCLQCQSGYVIQMSAGTYCVACLTGCKTCSDTSTCSQCFWNWKLVNSTCVSINSNCSLISNCQSCDYTNNSVRCVVCNYPYYLSSNNTCVQGSSILCQYSVGQNAYQCINQCSSMAYASSTVLSTTKNINQIICLPKLWIANTMIQQVYFNALYYTRYQSNFLPYNPSIALCGSQYLYSNSYSSGSNNLIFLYTFQPYYKLIFYIKYVPIFRSLFPTTIGLNLTVKMSDNATNTYSTLYPFSSSQFIACQQEYLTISSRNIKDQQVTIQLASQLNPSSFNDTQLGTMLPNGLLGYREILIQVYRCDSSCRVCSNSMYCLQCYGNLFLSSYLCVDNCNGLFEFYLPDGDYVNYKSKYCLQQCYSGYYSTVNPLKNGTYICLKCPSQCLTCKSLTQCLSCQSPYLLFSTNFSCISACPNTHYPSLSTLECLPCNAPCKTCVNETQCLSCSIGYFDGSNCVGSCSVGTYSSDSLRQCLSCDSKCSTCQNTPTFCTSCNQPYKLLGTSCLDNCPINTYYPYNDTCLSCKSPCLLCLSQVLCLTCSRGYLFNQTCLTDCPSGYYKDMGNSKCNLCQNNCLTCLSVSICRTCVNGTFLYNSMCLSQCPIKTYTSPSKICIPCIPPCLTCNNQTSCITCSLGYLSQATPNTCVTQCEDGYYGQSTNQSCMQCSSNCKTCNQQSTYCLTCYTGMLLQNNLCLTNCSLGYFAFNNEKCRPCSYPCQTCVDISSKCLTCVDPYILTGENKCSLQCLSSQYKQNGSCLNCQNPCDSCIDATSCLSCTRNTTVLKYLLNVSCVASCPKGMYGDSLSLKCKSCLYPCSQCLSSSECLSCISGYLNVAKKTCQVCSSTYYPNDTTKTCQLCSSAISNCSQCQSSTVCTVCFSDFYLLNSTCVSLLACQSIAGYYVNSQLKKCSVCIPPRNTCLNSSFCLSCANGYLFEGRCPFTCPSGYYANMTAKQCNVCNTTICMTCSNSANQCTSCYTNSTLPVYFVENKTCISSSNCQQSYYLDNLYGYPRCLKCISPCKTCSNASYCLSCTSGVLYQGSCSFSCPNKFYADQTVTIGVATCEQCSNTCLQCSTNNTNCISCPVTKLLEDNICVANCSSGYYLNQYILQCFQCESPCLQCESATYCKSCQDSKKILYYGQCIDQCPEGTYITNQQCLSCPTQCQLCSYSNTTNGPLCDKCSSNLFMNSTSYGVCQVSCKLNEYGDIQTRKCYPCQVPCNECYTATKCKSCISGYLIYRGQCFKGTSCMVGTYMDPFQPQCLDQCYDPYFGDALTKLCSLQCTQKRLKVPVSNNRVCSTTCPSGYYVDDDYLCSICGQNSYDCYQLLEYEIYIKSIFNKLYVKVRFNKQVLTQLISEKNITISLSDLSSSRRLLLPSQLRSLQSINTTANQQQLYSFQITQRTPQALWLQIDTYETLKNMQVKVQFNSYYLLSPTPNARSPSTNLQQLNSSVLLSRFDQYTTEQQQQGKPYETYSMFLSILLFIIIIISIIGNFLSLFYPLIDYFQILFMIEFLQIDYPPDLNYFLYGFRYSHYLFLPQIFSSSSSNRQQYSQTPGKFGIIVPDADFLTNTGHDFLIIFVCIAIVIIVKLIDFLLSGHTKNNKVSNDPSIKNNFDLVKNEIISSNNSHQHPQQDQRSLQKSKKQNSENISQDNNKEPIQTHNVIEQQILEGKHGKIIRYSKIFISRLKWNYFNDVCYCLYFYIALFSYSQYYIITQAKFISSLLAVLGFLFSLFLPAFFIYLINKNRSIIQQEGNNQRVYLPFKTFYYFTIPDSGYSLYQIPIRYVRKLLIAILLIYCSQFPEFVLGIIMMFSLLNIIMIFIYKPFIITFEKYAHGLIELLFMIVIFSICLLQLEYLDLSTSNKLTISKFVVAFTIILTIVLVCWYILRFAVQIIKQLCQKDYFENYYKKPDTISQSQIETKSKRDPSLLNYKQNHQNNQIHEQSNVRLHELSANDRHEISSFGRQSSEEYSGLDIYLKKQHDAPPMLIKCMKKFSDQLSKSSDQDQHQSSQNNKSEKQDNENQLSQKIFSHEVTQNVTMPKIDYSKEQFIESQINKKVQMKSEPKKQAQQERSQSNKNDFNQKDQVNSGKLQRNSKTNEAQRKQQNSNNIFECEQEQQQEKQQNQQKSIEKEEQPTCHPIDVKQIFQRNRNRDKNKMSTIIQVQDFDIGQSLQQKQEQSAKMPISQEDFNENQDKQETINKKQKSKKEQQTKTQMQKRNNVQISSATQGKEEENI